MAKLLPRLLLSAVTIAAVVAVFVAFAPERGIGLDPRAIQETSNPTGESPWLGQTVEVEGVVVAIQPHGLFYYVASPAGGAWSGLKVAGAALERKVGERVLVEGVVAEPSGETQLEEIAARAQGQGRLPSPTRVTLAELLGNGEPWEGVLVRVEEVTVEGFTSDFGEFPIRDATASGGEVDDEFFYSYIADFGDTFASITGIISWGFGDWRIEPRADGDFEGLRSARPNDAALVVDVRDREGRFLPSRVTLFAADGSALHIGPDDRAEGTEDVAYIQRPRQTVAVPSGTYDVVVSRGIEYGIWEERITVPAGGEARIDAVLIREVDTRGWISGDFHLHAAPSSDTPLPVPGRIASLAGEGVEWAVATDHNMVTDYDPIIRELGIEDWITSSIGDEITTRSPSYGHFNAWPLHAGSLPSPFEGMTPAALFSAARSDPGVEVVQVNHPIVVSWGNQYYQIYAVSPFTGEPADAEFSFDFDALEVFNGQFLGEGLTNLDIWMRQLNNGHRITATGNSDSHHLVFREPGYPRNYVASSAEGPRQASEQDLVAAVLGGRVFVSYGPLIDLQVNGVGLGDLAAAPDGIVRLHARIQCASWLDVNVARVYANGKLLAEQPLLREGPGPLELVVHVEDRPSVDTWYLLFVDGPGDLSPVRRGQSFRPLAFTNPVWVDVDGNGGFDPPGNVADAVTIAELDQVDANGVPLRLGAWVSVTGCALTDTRFGDPSLGVFYVDDGTGGVQVREAVGTITEVHRGDRVWVGGFVAQTLGEMVLTESEVQILGSDPSCASPIDATTGSIAAGGLEALEGRAVRVAGANVTSGTWPSGGAEGAVTVDDGSGAVTLLVPSGVVVPPEAGSLVDFAFTALLTQRDFSQPFTSGYRLTLRDALDLGVPGAAPTGAGELGFGALSFGVPRPNPFRDAIRVPLFGRPGGTVPRVEVLDVTGRRVRSLVLERPDAGGIVWDGRDADGRVVAAGVYWLRLSGAERASTIRVVKMR